jgi:hypothetical protein
MDNLINKYSKEIVDKLENNLEALILVGSYSREEEIEGLSDIEFWAVVKDLSKANKPQLNNKVSLGFTTREHLQHLKPYIYTLEVKKYGKVVYGDENILNLIPDFSFEDIEPIDGFILLNNRIIEQLILLNKIEDNQIINQYDFDKGYIQLVNALLVLKKQYEGLYPEKLTAFRKIYKDDTLLSRVELAFVSLDELARMVINKSDALKKWEELRGYFRKVYLDGMETLGGFKCWLKLLATGKPRRLFIYREAAALYFSQGNPDRKKRDSIIKQWERFVK